MSSHICFQAFAYTATMLDSFLDLAMLYSSLDLRLELSPLPHYWGTNQGNRVGDDFAFVGGFYMTMVKVKSAYWGTKQTELETTLPLWEAVT